MSGVSLADWLIGLSRNRKPDLVVGSEEDPYLHRWWLIPKNRFFNIYLHRFMRSDDDRALHDHPWLNLSILLRGRYTEHTIADGGINVRTVRVAGETKLRRPKAAHRIELTHGECWTLFITGPKLREWGFHCPKGWILWTDFVDNTDGVSRIGAGCP